MLVVQSEVAAEKRVSCRDDGLAHHHSLRLPTRRVAAIIHHAHLPFLLIKALEVKLAMSCLLGSVCSSSDRYPRERLQNAYEEELAANG